MMKIGIKKIMLYSLVFVFINTFLLSNVIKVYADEESYFGEYKKIAHSSKLELYFNERDSSLAIKNKVSGFIWSSCALNDKFLETSKLNKQIQEELRSLFVIYYTNIVGGQGTVISSSLVSLQPEMSFQKIRNGIKVNYHFKNIGIKFDVEITIDDTSLYVRIPGDSILEEGNMKLIKIKMLPYFGASTDEEEGYFFYPDGSGAIMEFTDLNHYGENPKSWIVYGTDISNVFDPNMSYEYCMLPVYGVKKSNDAFLAVIEEGDENSIITLTPSNDVLKLNSISCEFVYRNSFNDLRVKTRILKQYDKEIQRRDCKIKYIFLENESANYSGMANSYRIYLLENGKISKQISKNDRIPLGLDLFMGINQRIMLFNKFICMTSFKEAQTILQEFLDAGVYDIQVCLKGWTKRGYLTEPLHFPPNNKLGGKSGLIELADFAQNHNIDLLLEISPIFANGANGGFSKRNDVVYLGNKAILTDVFKKWFVLSPKVVLERFINNILIPAKDYSISGISFKDIGRYLYYDYNEKNFSSKKQTKDYLIKMLDNTNKEFNIVMTKGGNAYVLNKVQRLADIPTKCSGYYFTTKSVPFYQMVVHGLIPYTSNIPGNLSPNFEREKLEWIEKGYMPYFELTYKPADLLKYTEYNTLFSSTYSDWIEKAVAIYNEFNENLGDIWSEYIIKHEELEKDVVMVTYSNNTRIIINYSDKDVKIGGKIVKALDYLVIR